MNLWPWLSSLWPFKNGSNVSTQDLLILGRNGTDGVLGAVEACAALWSDAVASAVLASPYPVSAAERVCLVRDYLLRGEAVRRVDIEDGRPVLTPAVASHVYGAGMRPESWRYNLHLTAPDGTSQATYPAARVFHWRRAPSVTMPWQGRSVLHDAPALAALAGAVERSLVGEHQTPIARLLGVTVPWKAKTANKSEHEQSLWERINLSSAGDGEVIAMQWDRGQEASDKPGRIGAEPTDGSVELRDQLRRDVCAAFGIPPGMVYAESGSAQSTRELRSLWARGRVTPLLDTLAAELSRVFGSPVSFTLPLLEAETAEAESRRRQRRAVSIGALVRGGMTVEAATALHDAGA